VTVPTSNIFTIFGTIGNLGVNFLIWTLKINNVERIDGREEKSKNKIRFL